MVIFIGIGLSLLLTLCIPFPFGVYLGIPALLYCLFSWYAYYDKAQCIYRDWRTAKASIQIYKQQRQTILKQVLDVVDKYSAWNMEAIEKATESTPAVWWLQERFPKRLETMENAQAQMSQLIAIERQINIQKAQTARLAGHLMQMKMDQFFGACTPNFIVVENIQDVVPSDLMGYEITEL